MKKRVLALIMAAVTVLGMSACGKKEVVKEETVSYDNFSNYIASFAEYRGLTAEAELQEISEDMLDFYTEYFFSLEAEDIKNFPARLGDTVIIDYVGTIDGVAFSGGTASGESLRLGSQSYISGFEDGLVGAVAGEKRTLNLTFPENYAEDLAGKAVVFEVTVDAVVPLFNDEGVAALGSSLYSTELEYKNAISQALVEYAREDYETTIVDQVVTQIIEESEFKDIPKSFLDAQKAIIVEQNQATAASYNLDVETYLRYAGTSLDTLVDLFAKQQLVFYKICSEQNLYPTEEYIQSEAEKLAEYYDYASVTAFFVDTPREELIDSLINNSVYEYLLEVTNVVAPKE